MKTKIERVWYFVLMILTCLVGSAFIAAHVDSAYSATLCIIWGFILGIFWDTIWQVIFANMFNCQEDERNNKD